MYLELLQTELEKERLARIDAEKKLEGKYTDNFYSWSNEKNIKIYLVD